MERQRRLRNLANTNSLYHSLSSPSTCSTCVFVTCLSFCRASCKPARMRFSNRCTRHTCKHYQIARMVRRRLDLSCAQVAAAAIRQTHDLYDLFCTKSIQMWLTSHTIVWLFARACWQMEFSQTQLAIACIFERGARRCTWPLAIIHPEVKCNGAMYLFITGVCVVYWNRLVKAEDNSLSNNDWNDRQSYQEREKKQSDCILIFLLLHF